MKYYSVHIDNKVCSRPYEKLGAARAFISKIYDIKVWPRAKIVEYGPIDGNETADPNLYKNTLKHMILKLEELLNNKGYRHGSTDQEIIDVIKILDDKLQNC